MLMHAAIAIAALTASSAALDEPVDKPVDERYVLDFTMPRIDGTEQRLDEYGGKVVLVVNTASKCGLTPQYEGLQKLYKTYKDRGLVILGFPANNFNGQEPGTNAEISQFCTSNYGITFPMFSKISVKGKDQHPLYQKLTNLPAPIGGPVQWNFQKYLVDRSGKVVAKLHPTITPDDPELVSRIEALLEGAN